MTNQELKQVEKHIDTILNDEHNSLINILECWDIMLKTPGINSKKVVREQIEELIKTLKEEKNELT